MIIRVLISMLLIASGLPVFLLGCNNTQNTERDNSMAPQNTMPSIDASAPVNTETATFALG